MSENNSNNNQGAAPVFINASETATSSAAQAATATTLTMQNNRLFEAVTNKEAFIHELMEAKENLAVELAKANAELEAWKTRFYAKCNNLVVTVKSIFSSSTRPIEVESTDEAVAIAVKEVAEATREAVVKENATSVNKLKRLEADLETVKTDLSLAVTRANEDKANTLTAHTREIAKLTLEANNKFNDTVEEMEREHAKEIDVLNEKIERLDAGNKYATMEEEISSLQLELAKRDASFITVNWKALIGKK